MDDILARDDHLTLFALFPPLVYDSLQLILALFFGISQRRGFFKILGYDRRFFPGADRLDLFLDSFASGAES